MKVVEEAGTGRRPERMSSSALGNESSEGFEDNLYTSWYIDEPAGEETSPPDEFIPNCQPTIPLSLFHTCMAPLSLATMLTLTLLVKRRRLSRECWTGVPGLLSPVNFLEEEGPRGPAAAVFGILFSSLCVLVLAENPMPMLTHTSAAGREFWKIIALLYYPAYYYPLIACATVRHRVGYILGCLLSWTHCGVLIWQKVECPQSPEIYRYYSLLSHLPIILFLLFLSFWYPKLLLKSFTQKRTSAGLEMPGNHYYQEYLKHVLDPRKQRGSSSLTKQTLASRLIAFLGSYLYAPQQGFRLPLQLIISATLVVVAIYQVALLLLVVFIPTMQKVRAGITEDIAFLLAGFGVILSEDKQEVMELVKHYLWALEVCYVSALVLSCLVTFFMLMSSLVAHRANLKALYRGAKLSVFCRPRNVRPSRMALFCWMSFTSYQTAFACLGLLIQQLIFFHCIVAFAFLVAVPILYGRNLLLFQVLKMMWPFWLTLVLAVLLQNLAARCLFLKDHLGHQELTNRRAFYIVTFLLFPINVLVGVLAGVWRIVLSALYNIVHLCLLHLSLLNRGVETLDPGYRTYCYFLKIEVSQSHPVMKAFCSLLLQLSCSKPLMGLKSCDVEEGIQLMHTKNPTVSRARSRQARARWWLTYTLLHNPALLAFRKTVLTDSQANGKQSSPTQP
ncbi:receptor for retinol uptake STRA6 isoform X2 [Ornithorhynchus anatinus]|uniref:receptor for retinol uptake STRA6 isoform X2 n=1 Tax=Ornithorhynchus anatinus TaxID=9258 RepID=UPI0010A7A07D|nr:receptor for retinol uptake STRA6 isoform X2 [Ornithorhynchus anatinus]